MDMHPPDDAPPDATANPDTTPPLPVDSQHPAAGTSAGFFDAIRGLGIQRADDRWIGGVCAGLSGRFGLDPLVWRGILAASALLGGIGLVLYGLAWALLPERRDGRIHLAETIAGHFDVALLGAIGFVVVGLGRGGHIFSPGPGWVGGFFGFLEGTACFALIAGIIVAGVRATRKSSGRARTAPTPYGPTPYGSAPHASAPYGAPPYAPHQPGPPRPPRPRVHGPGAAAVGVVVALALLVFAGLLAADRAGSFTGPVGLTALGVAVVLAGLGIIVSGLRGRSSGVLGFLAIVAIVVALPVGVAGQTSWNWNSGVHHFAGDTDRQVLTRTEAAEGFTQGFGDARIDLSNVPMTDVPLDVPIGLGAGDLTVVVGRDTAVTADVRLRAGQMTWAVDDTPQYADGVSARSSTFTDGASRTGVHQLDLHLTVGAGNITVIREES